MFRLLVKCILVLLMGVTLFSAVGYVFADDAGSSNGTGTGTNGTGTTITGTSGTGTNPQPPAATTSFGTTAKFNIYGSSNINHLNPDVFLGRNLPGNNFDLNLGVDVGDEGSANDIISQAQRLLLPSDLSMLINAHFRYFGNLLIPFATAEMTFNTITDNTGTIDTLMAPALVAGFKIYFGDAAFIGLSAKFISYGAIQQRQQLFRDTFGTYDTDCYSWAGTLEVPIGSPASSSNNNDLLAGSYLVLQVNNYISKNMYSIINDDSAANGGSVFGVGITKQFDTSGVGESEKGNVTLKPKAAQTISNEF